MWAAVYGQPARRRELLLSRGADASLKDNDGITAAEWAVRNKREKVRVAFERQALMLLVIDNYDSFTYNLVQYLGELGETVEVRRNNRVTIDEIENSLRPERIVISPGPGTPDDAGITLDVIAHFSGKIPLLGVCLGHQAIGQAFGRQGDSRA